MQRWFRRLFESGPSGAGEALLLSLLSPLGLLYGSFAALRAEMFRRGLRSAYRAPVPVISVGNLSLGGTGKTPVVDYLVRNLLQRGRRVAVVSRGYGGSGVNGVGVVSAGDGAAPRLDVGVSGDEPLLLAWRNPQAVVLVAPRRQLGVERAVAEFNADVIVLDDGFQHLPVARDLDIVLLDAARPFGVGRVFPAGLLREFPAALVRADLVLYTRSEGSEPFPELSLPFGRCRHILDPLLHDLDGGKMNIPELAGRRGLAFAGIAAPDAFFRQLRANGLQLVDCLALDDHVNYAPQLLRALAAAATGADFFVTTEKDGVKLRSCDLPLPCFQVGLTLAFEPPDILDEALDRLFSQGTRR